MKLSQLLAKRARKSHGTPGAFRIVLNSGVFLVILALGSAGQHKVIPDAWAGATNTSNAKPTPANPTLRITSGSASPKLANNSVQVVEGGTVSFCVSTKDPNGYGTINLLASGLPAGATFNKTFPPCNPDSTVVVAKEFSWTPQAGDATSSSLTKVKFVASNYYFSPNPTHAATIKIAVLDTQQPVLDAITSIQQLTVGAPLDLQVASAGDSVDSDPVTISALDKPKSAKLQPTVLAKSGPNSGKWVSHFKWKPTKADYVAQPNGGYTVSFIAEDENPAVTGSQTPQTDVLFTLVPPTITDSAIKQLKITRAAWSNQTLAVSGRVQFKQHFAMVANLGVMLADAANNPLNTTPITVLDNGRWTYTNQGITPIPCNVSAKIVHIAADQTLTEATTASASHAVKVTGATCQP